MNTCDTCKHWHWWKGFEERNESYLMKPCNHEKCKNIAEDLNVDGFEVFSSIDSYLGTGPKFGCIHHQPKP